MCNLLLPWCSCKILHLTWNNNHWLSRHLKVILCYACDKRLNEYQLVWLEGSYERHLLIWRILPLWQWNRSFSVTLLPLKCNNVSENDIMNYICAWLHQGKTKTLFFAQFTTMNSHVEILGKSTLCLSKMLNSAN